MTEFPVTFRAARPGPAALLLAGLALAGAGVPWPPGPALAAGAAPTAAAEEAFVSGLGDVPAMPGLTPAESEPLVFDKPSGRIAQALLQGPVERRAILTFYGRSLPQLGWTRLADTQYAREGEELRLEFVEPRGAPVRPARTFVRFTLSPR
ncbi:hypothetical protein [Azospirillum sp. SYSU D00513]|uniref:hypothetical protein n=1 Tax=Azospirillum sp. SYSU D00513 TaxID=2812561 RepID=UPI001A971F25|nr:hypothetical protein [Azospirillum sp. SYSU D00513]